MENQGAKSTFIVAIQYAAICAVLTSVVTLICYLTGFSFFWGGVFANLAKALTFLVAFIVFAIAWRKKQEAVTYKTALVFGLMVVAGYVVFMFIFDFCFYQFIAPNFYQELRDSVLQMMIDYNVPQSQIDETDEQFAKGVENATSLGMSMQMLITRVIADCILLLIVSIFVRKKPPVVNASIPSATE